MHFVCIHFNTCPKSWPVFRAWPSARHSNENTGCRCNRQGAEINRDRGRQRRSKLKKTPASVCVRGTHPYCALKTRHYRDSQMIGLLKTTGRAAKTSASTNCMARRVPVPQVASSMLDIIEGTFPRKGACRNLLNNFPIVCTDCSYRSTQTSLQGTDKNMPGICPCCHDMTRP